MPRARTDESEDVIVTKKPRAPRERVTSADVVTPAPRKRAPRKTAAKADIAHEAVLPEPESFPQRKAPTTLASDRKHSSRSNTIFVVVTTLCVLLVGAGVVVGLFDHGPIDVLTVVTNRNEKIARGEVRDENGQVITVPVSAQENNRPNGGLIVASPADIPVAPAVTPESTTTLPTKVATSTATTTTATTTSTTTTPAATASKTRPAR